MEQNEEMKYTLVSSDVNQSPKGTIKGEIICSSNDANDILPHFLKNDFQKSVLELQIQTGDNVYYTYQIGRYREQSEEIRRAREIFPQLAALKKSFEENF